MAKKARAGGPILDPAAWPASNVDMRAVDELIPYAGNARTHPPEQVAQIAASMRRWGFTIPVLVADDGTIIAGHGRILAARQIGLAQVPVMVARGWSDEDRRLYTLADNRLAETSEWDADLLRLEIDQLLSEGLDDDLSQFGFSAAEIEAMLPGALAEIGAGLTDDDDVPDVPSISITKPGDVWLLGEHRLVCGDSTSAEVLARACGGRAVDGCWTDPPYNVAYSTSAGSIANDDLPDEEFRAFLVAALSATAAQLRPGAPIYVAHADTELIACQKLGRRACLAELDPHYCDVIVRRWQEYTGGTALLEADGTAFDEAA